MRPPPRDRTLARQKHWRFTRRSADSIRMTSDVDRFGDSRNLAETRSSSPSRQLWPDLEARRRRKCVRGLPTRASASPGPNRSPVSAVCPTGRRLTRRHGATGWGSSLAPAGRTAVRAHRVDSEPGKGRRCAGPAKRVGVRVRGQSSVLDPKSDPSAKFVRMPSLPISGRLQRWYVPRRTSRTGAIRVRDESWRQFFASPNRWAAAPTSGVIDANMLRIALRRRTR